MIFFYLLVGSMPLTQHPLLTKLVGGDVTLFKVLGLICLFFALLRVVARGSLPPLLTKGPAPWAIIYLVVAIASCVAHVNLLFSGLSPFANLLCTLLLLPVTVVMVDNSSRLRWVLLVNIGAVGIASVYVVREWYQWHNVYPNFRGWGGVTQDPNYFALSALLTLPISFYLMMGPHPRWQRFFCLTCFAITLLAMTLGASRGGFLGLVAGSLFVVIRSRQRVRNLALLSVMVAPLALLAPSSPLKRFTNPTHDDEEAADNRIVVWRAGWKMFKDHPMTGVGLTRFIPSLWLYEQNEPEYVWNVAHNTYLEVAAEMGLLGLLPVLGLLTSTYLTLGQVARRALLSGSALLEEASRGMQAGLVAYMVACFFVSGLQRDLWLMIFLSLSMACFKDVAGPPDSASSTDGAKRLTWAV